MLVSEIFMEGLSGSIHNVALIALIVIPFMILVEVFKDLNLLNKLTSILSPLTRFLGISEEGNLPLLAGLLFGISYGGGIIINSAREGELGINDIVLINVFLVICHSLLEDTMLFAAIGAKWLPVLLVRIVLAIVIVYFYSLFLKTEYKILKADKARG